VGGKAASITTCDVLVMGSGNLDLRIVYQLARRSCKHAALWNEQSEIQHWMPVRSRYRMTGHRTVPLSTIVV
jgi:hypothetical protein